MAIRERIVIEGDSRDAEKAFDRAGKSFSDMDRKIAGALGLAAGATLLAKAGVAAVGLAVDAEEAASAFATSFGPATADASRFVDEFAHKAGFATHELEQMLAITGSVVQGIGATEEESAKLSESMAILAGDVASFTNAQGGAETVLLALQSAINGEREALKTYGIALSEAEVQSAALNETGKTRASDLTRLEKAEVTIALAYDKASKAVGDLDRTQDSAANSMRRLGAEVKEAGVQAGQALLPAVEKLLPLVEDSIPALTDMALALAEISGFVVDLTGHVNEQGDAFYDSATSSVNWNTVLLKGVPILGEMAARADASARAQTNLEQVTIANHDATILATSGYQQIVGPIDRADQALFRVGGKFIGVATAAEEAIGPVTNLAGPVSELAGAYSDAARGAGNLHDALRAASDPVFAAVDAWTSYLDAITAANEDGTVTAREELDLLADKVDLSAALEALGTDYDAAMNALVLATGKPQAEIEALFEQLGLLDGETFGVTVNTHFTTSGSAAANEIAARSGRGPGGVPAFAGGGQNASGVPMWVGENGPELVVPGGPSTVLNHDESMRAVEGRARAGFSFTWSGNVVVQGGAADPRQVGRQVSREVLRELSSQIRSFDAEMGRPF